MQREVGPGISSGVYCYIAGKLAIVVPVDNLHNFDSDTIVQKSRILQLPGKSNYFLFLPLMGMLL
jgi:hypothetical protein